MSLTSLNRQLKHSVGGVGLRISIHPVSQSIEDRQEEPLYLTCGGRWSSSNELKRSVSYSQCTHPRNWQAAAGQLFAHQRSGRTPDSVLTHTSQFRRRFVLIRSKLVQSFFGCLLDLLRRSDLDSSDESHRLPFHRLYQTLPVFAGHASPR